MEFKSESLVDTTTTIPMHERRWIDTEPSEPSLSLRSKSRRKSSVFFDTIKQYRGQKMEQFNSGELSFIFEIKFHKTNIGRMIVGKHACQQEEDQKEDISSALIFQEQLLTSELFKDTQDVVSLILHYRTM